MSDDELQYVKRQKVVHFGALDESAIPVQQDGPVSDNIQLSAGYLAWAKEVMPNDKIEMLEEFERRKRVRAINVSTNDIDVKGDLRSLGMENNILNWLGDLNYCR